ncbi:MAG: aspartate carbamoyltransferase regulatory subunit [Clostridia bacterium]|nr:aspartate carbamoyltransferase regulatory subunit [Clostridia bacterium]
MIIDAIKNGIVIDHIKAGHGMDLYNILKLGELDCSVALIKNVASVKYGKKDIIKIDELLDINYDVLGYVAPECTVNVIKDGVLAEKLTVSIPESIEGVIKCKNPRCITSTEQEIVHIFKLADREKRVYRCMYCDTQAKK